MSEKFEIGWRTIFRVIFFLLLIYFIYVAREALGVLLTAMVIAMGIDPIVSFLETKRLNRLLGTIIVFLTGIFLLSTAVYFVLPVLLYEAAGFLEHVNRAVASIIGLGLPPVLIQSLSSSLDKVLGFFTGANFSLTGAISTVVTRVVLVISTILVSFYLSVEQNGVERLLRVILPDFYEKSVLSIFVRFKVRIRRWFVTQLGLSLLIGVIYGLGMWLLGVDYALVLGIMGAIFELVPVIGPVLSGAVMVLVAVSQSFSLGLYALLFAFIVQQLEGHILIPIIMGRAMKVHPVVVIIALLAGAEIAGFVGIVLSVPIAVMAQETFNYFSEKKSSRTSLDI
ncbi:MAG: hypothetical protein UY23_C0001G0247 [Candidatus Jorgensenbacteria bacterium GW2011_GWA1_48_11]|uniref:Permease n=1 Tax=Candidatus Jorgensenbacteria bacterium GW2011_GWA1_48_11 TaxID=1618660 RepID=A0A0G1UBV5_9BACT|nr:MAG: hypothetical protein UY23_C0001G0247 [Candidatus Jorgensenbacteria bacterium GW2011_GWA1_48_11]KKW12133.1 MAG: hypothetical protein UY51_C0005G0375 [Candidatus Jorgensenbacteria bacterium GW2011_GWB1_49_9]